MSSVLLMSVTAGGGVFAVVLGIVHLGIPRIVGYRAAIGTGAAGATATVLGIGRLRYQVRRSDLVGITWVMSNAASYVLITIGIVDLAWAAGWRGLPIAVGALWIAGWWFVRAAGQFAVGRRSGDVLVAAWFAALAAGHVALAFGPG